MYKAAGIVEALEPATAAPFFKRVARHYEGARDLEAAERYYVRGGAPGEAVEMYTRADKWEVNTPWAAINTRLDCG